LRIHTTGQGQSRQAKLAVRVKQSLAWANFDGERRLGGGPFSNAMVLLMWRI
jgi:hypothetical protein